MTRLKKYDEVCRDNTYPIIGQWYFYTTYSVYYKVVNFTAHYKTRKDLIILENNYEQTSIISWDEFVEDIKNGILLFSENPPIYKQPKYDK